MGCFVCLCIMWCREAYLLCTGVVVQHAAFDWAFGVELRVAGSHLLRSAALLIVGSNCLCWGSWHRQWVQVWSRLLLAPTGCGLGTADAVPLWVHTSQLQEWCCNLHIYQEEERGRGEGGTQSGQSRDGRSLTPPAPHLTVLHTVFEATSAIS